MTTPLPMTGTSTSLAAGGSTTFGITYSALDTNSRSAELQFSRTTRYRGEVHAHPQDPALKAPLVEGGLLEWPARLADAFVLLEAEHNAQIDDSYD